MQPRRLQPATSAVGPSGGGGGQFPGDRGSLREEHLSWLRAQRDDLAEHRRSSMRGSSEDEDVAVGADACTSSFSFESVPTIADTDCEEVIYRSLDMSPQSLQPVEVEETTVVYRSLPPMISPQPSAASDIDTHTEHPSDAVWLAAGRPIAETAERLQQCLRGGRLVARLGARGAPAQR